MNRFEYDHRASPENRSAEQQTRSRAQPNQEALRDPVPLLRPVDRPRGWDRSTIKNPLFESTFGVMRSLLSNTRFLLITGGFLICVMTALLVFLITPKNEVSPTPMRVIRAPDSALKIRPDEPGGITIPHQDKHIYDAIAPDTRNKVSGFHENDVIAPQPDDISLENQQSYEEDKNISINDRHNLGVTSHNDELGDGQIIQDSSGNEIMLAPNKLNSADSQESRTAEDITLDDAFLASPEPTLPEIISSKSILEPYETPSPAMEMDEEMPLSIAKEPVKKPKTISSPVVSSAQNKVKSISSSKKTKEHKAKGLSGQRKLSATTKSLVVASANYHLQLATVSQRKPAEAESKRLWQRNRDLLGRFRASVHPYQKSANSAPLYRVLVSPVPSAQAAKKLCAQLRNRNVSCQIIHPKSYVAVN